MPKRFNAKIGQRDIEILIGLDRTPMTPAQLCRLSKSFAAPFRDENNLRRRLRVLADSGLIRSWPYAVASDGRSPRYFKLTRDGYRLLYGSQAALPRRRYFEEISHGHHHHTMSLADVIVHLVTAGHQHGIGLRHFGRENSVKLETSGFTMYPDCVFQLVTREGRTFNFVIELDNGTERIRTRQDVESIERKLRGYDAHQSQFGVNDPDRYVVVFVTTRGRQRLEHILDLAGMLTSNPQRTVFVGCDLATLIGCDPFSNPALMDHRGCRRTLLPEERGSVKKPTCSMTPATVS